jgi:hypothetical protein
LRSSLAFSSGSSSKASGGHPEHGQRRAKPNARLGGQGTPKILVRHSEPLELFEVSGAVVDRLCAVYTAVLRILEHPRARPDSQDALHGFRAAIALRVVYTDQGCKNGDCILGHPSPK